ncbi:MAG: sialate O-acetylesterase [Muribaculaceae bacterium]|nr:sialate O-acetylesterase [Muribaculaceae bacterium]
MKIFRLKTILCLSLLCLGYTSVTADSYYDRRVSLFEFLPVYENDIVFLGNSITDGGEFSELLKMPNVKNRGIASDVMGGVEKRLDQVLRGHPQKLFLLIGINDVSHKLTVEQLASRYSKLVKKIREISPDTKVYLQSVMPINNDFKRYKSLYGTENVIKGFNNQIARIADEEGCVFIDLTAALSDPKTGKLKRNFTNDGLHLTGAGYKAWMEVVEPYVKE